jgi:hypothetical protein
MSKKCIELQNSLGEHLIKLRSLIIYAILRSLVKLPSKINIIKFVFISFSLNKHFRMNYQEFK